MNQLLDQDESKTKTQKLKVPCGIYDHFITTVVGKGEKKKTASQQTWICEQCTIKT